MKTGLIVVLTLLAGTILAALLMEDPGYVLLNFRGYIVETSVPIIVLMLLLGYAAVRLLIRVLRAPRQLGRAAGRLRERKTRRLLTDGLLEIAEGNWSRAERLLTRGVRNNEAPLLNYLSAARAAQLQGAYERRDNWLRMAYEQDPESATAVLLTQAELQMEHGQFEEARATIARLLDRHPDHAQGLCMLGRLHAARNDWQGLREILPRLGKYKLLPRDELDRLALQAYRQALATLAAEPDAAALEDTWGAVPRHLRDDPQLVSAWTRALQACGRTEQAESIIRKTLKKRWDPELVLQYGRLDYADRVRQLSRAEAWLGERSDDPVLLLTVARLSMRNELWGKARSYLETSLSIRPSAEAYQVYGGLLEKLGESRDASEAFRAGLALSNGPDTPLPALGGPSQSG